MKYIQLMEKFLLLVILLLSVVAVFLSFGLAGGADVLTQVLLVILVVVQIVTLTVFLRIYEKLEKR